MSIGTFPNQPNLQRGLLVGATPQNVRLQTTEYWHSVGVVFPYLEGVLFFNRQF